MFASNSPSRRRSSSSNPISLFYLPLAWSFLITIATTWRYYVPVTPFRVECVKWGDVWMFALCVHLTSWMKHAWASSFVGFPCCWTCEFQNSPGFILPDFSLNKHPLLIIIISDWSPKYNLSTLHFTFALGDIRLPVFSNLVPTGAWTKIIEVSLTWESQVFRTRHTQTKHVLY